MLKYFKIIFSILILLHLLISLKLGNFGFYDFDIVQILHMYILYNISILGFSWFDIIGYSEIVRKKYNLKKSILIIYRIIQTIVQWGIAIYVWSFFPEISILYILSWWLGVCDHYYYVLNDDEREWYFSHEIRHMEWLWWTAFGILYKKWRNNFVLQLVSNFIIYFSLILIPILYFLNKN
jgi:hypothetical protein